jgi:phosphate acetyltransferase
VNFRDSLRRRASTRGATILLPESGDLRVQAAAARLRSEGIADAILIGPGALEPGKDPRLPRVAQLLRDRRPDQVEDAVHAIDLASDPLRFAAGLVALGEADGCVAGAVHTTADVLRAALWTIGPAPGVSCVSSAFYMVLPDQRVFTFTDCAVVPEPTAEELASIALGAARDRTRLVGDTPKVAFLSYSSHGSARGPAIERVKAALAIFREIAPDIVVDGELQVDAAIDAEVARRKAPDSPLAGEANVLVFPDLNCGNIAYKLVHRMGGAVALGPLLQGLARPMSDLSRGASTEDIVEVVAMVALQGTEAPDALDTRGLR